MKYLINSINTLSAGTISVLKNTVDDINNIEAKCFVPDLFERNKNIIPVSGSSGSLKFVVRFFFEILFSIYSYIYRPDSVLIMANYSILPTYGKKKVLVRNPYLVDIEAKKKLTKVKDRVLDKIRDVAFIITLKSTDTIFVQSQFMKNGIVQRFRIKDSTNIIVLPNPVSYTIREYLDNIEEAAADENYFIYPSRYYPHKNFDFLVDFCDKKSSVLKSNNIKIFITLKQTKETEYLIRKIDKLTEVIVNLGEIEQSQLFNVYLKMRGLIFPSQSETFGNGLIEAQAFKLPIVVNDKNYARAVCHEGACFLKMEDESNYNDLCIALVDASKQSKNLLTKESKVMYPDEWLSTFLEK
ncbi:glycosyltransferase [Vibrio alginolyticus]|uniref:glycosyltransferase n=1 Tax=Vibrio alginolyticus TaxID=663 RepID=UPI000CE9906D|nr:glycosyltransferase [Vibrio alginolyticus]AVF67388.1 hypothetical protein AL541_25415 [Vibrio alginolyticus]